MIHSYLYLSIILFCLGIVGVISRRNVFTVFMSIELMLNAANLLLSLLPVFMRVWTVMFWR